MDFAEFLGKLFFPSNVVLIVFLILIYNNFSSMSSFDLFIYGLAVFGFPFTFLIMNKRSRRKNRAALIAILSTIIGFTLFSQIFRSLINLQSLYLATYSFLFLGLIIFFVRLRWKASLHVSILTTSITILSILHSFLYFLYLLIPLIAWSRIKLRIHTINQTVAGFLIGLIIPILIF